MWIGFLSQRLLQILPNSRRSYTYTDLMVLETVNVKMKKHVCNVQKTFK